MFYKYNTITGEYIGHSEDALYTLDGKLVNGYTREEPPAISEGEKAIFKNNAWNIPVDYRGIWEDINGDIQNITKLGITPKTGYAKENNGRWYFVDGTLATDITIKKLKERKLNDVRNKFNEMKQTRKIKSSLGFYIDNRRDGMHFDKDNIESLIALNVSPINFKDADGKFHSLTLDNLKTIRMEMIKDGLAMYQQKWTLEAKINNATTISEVEGMVIKW